MLTGDPKPVDPGSTVEDFIPDGTCTWVVTYAGPCVNPTCPGNHEQLYILPMVGWQRVTGKLGAEVRPAIMGASGIVTDYLDVPANYKFVAVLQDSDNVPMIAQVVYRKRFGGSMKIDEEAPSAIMN